MKDLNIIERKAYSNLSRMGGGRVITRVFAVLFILWGIGLLFVLGFYPEKIMISEMSFFVYLFAFSIIIGGAFTIKDTYDYLNHINQKYDERDVLKARIVKTTPAFIAVSIFCSLFIASGWYGAPLSFLLFGLFFGGILTIAAVYGQILTKRRLNDIRSILSSELRYLSKSPFVLGNTLKFELLNASASLEGKEIFVALRFLKEKYISNDKRVSGRNRSKSLKTICVYEDNINVLLESGKLTCEFTLPIRSVGPTKIDYSEPEYWELEFSNESEYYYSRFILDIKLEVIPRTTVFL